ncbi:hypothetical protein JI62_13210 [Halomonas campaniensis]|uniref:Uncharacterized protein n=1 Tax=Halomonas campaniensis TaxID=213554 RepID=A0A246RXE4_9GAMM|nr:hypothetical protein JI62_13210 [Halomonas campaniensis]
MSVSSVLLGLIGMVDDKGSVESLLRLATNRQPQAVKEKLARLMRLMLIGGYQRCRGVTAQPLSQKATY